MNPLAKLLSSIGRKSASKVVKADSNALTGSIRQLQKLESRNVIDKVDKSELAKLRQAIYESQSRRPFTQFEGGDVPEEAIRFLARKRTGVATNAIPTLEHGNVNLLYGMRDINGAGGSGLDHIIYDHPGGIQNAYDMLPVLRSGKISSGVSPTRTEYSLGGKTAVIDDQLFNKKMPWTVTTFDDFNVPSANGSVAGFEDLATFNGTSPANSVANNTTKVNALLDYFTNRRR